jgi:hypothetical protein
MTRDTRTKPESPMSRPHSSDRAPGNEEVPQGEFIDVLTNQPVDPGRLQVFPVPQEFLHKALANEPPRSNSEGVTNATSPQMRSEPSSRPSDLRTVIAPKDSSVTMVMSRRPGSAGLFARWAVTGKIPTSIKVVMVGFGVLILILAWANWNAVTPEKVAGGDANPVVPAAVPLIAPPRAIGETPRSTAPEGPSANANANSTPLARADSLEPRPAPVQGASETSAKTKKVSQPSGAGVSSISKPVNAPRENPQQVASSAPAEPNNPPKKKAWFSEE